jgi:hypothetical protein
MYVCVCVCVCARARARVCARRCMRRWAGACARLFPKRHVHKEPTGFQVGMVRGFIALVTLRYINAASLGTVLGLSQPHGAD